MPETTDGILKMLEDMRQYQSSQLSAMRDFQVKLFKMVGMPVISIILGLIIYIFTYWTDTTRTLSLAVNNLNNNITELKVINESLQEKTRENSVKIDKLQDKFYQK